MSFITRLGTVTVTYVNFMFNTRLDSVNVTFVNLLYFIWTEASVLK
ncbi:unnamed protein product [Acanthoscelides obtectus]|uniref:Uncharacterized protein n=1 Tax=Acanthoscelides obtectus TaxID=200917 RepID=A0A9P0K334_ACAOB|nr:unnamed protein product [Acanthoscelides obtectus]CAK1640392.1 hypothetical protein AOBTE_LOCUS11695 [Acanthoscelides obtectus]